MYNVLEQLPQVTRLVQVGVRDYSREEANYRQAQAKKVRTFYAEDLFSARASHDGITFGHQVAEMLAPLPQRVYVSFDIDGLDPPYCPNTGTPVPGGLSFAQAVYLLEQLGKSGREVIGFDLCEVAPGDSEWDANVGARILYKLCGCLLHSQGLC
jgi:agmatinase